MSQPLTTILITRPMGQHLAFANGCFELGLRVSHLPCISIEPLFDVPLSEELLSKTDSVLFTSKNAVLHAHRTRPLPWPETIVNAIGPATNAALAELNQSVQMMPMPPFNSESYLQQLRALPPQKLLIIKGSGGRTLIADQLRQLGWTVSSLDVYRRILPTIGLNNVNALMRDSAPNIVSITSNEALLNLKLLTSNHWDALRQLPLVVNSDRTAALAQSMGFTLPALVAASAGDEGQLKQVAMWLSEQNPITK